jgi:hypothetical protein
MTAACAERGAGVKDWIVNQRLSPPLYKYTFAELINHRNHIINTPLLHEDRGKARP